MRELGRAGSAPYPQSSSWRGSWGGSFEGAPRGSQRSHPAQPPALPVLAGQRLGREATIVLCTSRSCRQGRQSPPPQPSPAQPGLAMQPQHLLDQLGALQVWCRHSGCQRERQVEEGHTQAWARGASREGRVQGAWECRSRVGRCTCPPGLGSQPWRPLWAPAAPKPAVLRRHLQARACSVRDPGAQDQGWARAHCLQVPELTEQGLVG